MRHPHHTHCHKEVDNIVFLNSSHRHRHHQQMQVRSNTANSTHTQIIWYFLFCEHWNSITIAAAVCGRGTYVSCRSLTPSHSRALYEKKIIGFFSIFSCFRATAKSNEWATKAVGKLRLYRQQKHGIYVTSNPINCNFFFCSSPLFYYMVKLCSRWQNRQKPFSCTRTVCRQVFREYVLFSSIEAK